MLKWQDELKVKVTRSNAIARLAFLLASIIKIEVAKIAAGFFAN